MDEQTNIDVEASSDDGVQHASSKAVIVVLLVAAALLGFVAFRLAAPRTTADTASVAGSITTRSGSAVTDYQYAIASGRTIYVLFHSLS